MKFESHVLFLKTTGNVLIVEQVGGARDGDRQVFRFETYRTLGSLLGDASRLPYYFPGLSVTEARKAVYGGLKAEGAYEVRVSVKEPSVS